jgi:hypothetical protein
MRTDRLGDDPGQVALDTGEELARELFVSSPAGLQFNDFGVEPAMTCRIEASDPSRISETAAMIASNRRPAQLISIIFSRTA